MYDKNLKRLANTFSDLTASALVRACVESGGEEAWRELVLRTRRMIGLVVLRAARHWTEPSPALVEDLVQETYLKLCEKQCRALREFQPHNEEALFSYLKVIAIHVTNDHFKSVLALKRRSEQMAVPARVMEQSSDRESGRVSLEQDILLQQIDSLLRSQSDSGHPMDRQIFWLYYRGGLSARAISEIPGIGGSVKFVERRLARLTLDIREAVLARGNPRDVASGKSPGFVVDNRDRELG